MNGDGALIQMEGAQFSGRRFVLEGGYPSFINKYFVR